MAIQITEWEWVESVDGYEVWRRETGSCAYCYQITKHGDPKPSCYAGYANKHALLRLKGLL